MLKIGIEIPDNNFTNIDLSCPENGNPGIGGSEYLFDLLAKELCENNQDITIFHYSDNLLPNKCKGIILDNNFEMIDVASEYEIDVLIYQVGKSEEWYKILEKTRLNTIVWAHVYLDYNELILIRKCNNVKRVVFVGKEEYESYIDDDVIEKSEYIFNMIPTSKEYFRNENKNPIVTYVGSLVPAKGFHKLAEIWPDVLQRVPNAELNVIGNGKVYDRNARLGKFGISQEDYERNFIKYLLDDNGNILESIHFLGILGAEKIDVFKNTSVGVVNPTALTETFCMSAVEMEYAYIPVVSKAKWGLLDTVDSGKTGYLFKSRKQFVDYVVKLLNDNKLNRDMGINAHAFVSKKFSSSVIIPSWIKLINEVSMNQPAIYHPANKNWSNDFKLLKRCLRVLRFDMGLKCVPSFYDFKFLIKKLVGRQ